MPKPQAIQLPADVWRTLRHEWLWAYRGPVPQCGVWSAEIPFMERRRLNVARERIVTDHATLKEIAFALGFRHASHFTAWFRRHTGVSPSAYRLSGVEQAA